MLDHYEKGAICQYLHNLLTSRTLPTDLLAKMCDWFADNVGTLELASEDDALLEKLDDYQDRMKGNKGARRASREASRFLRDCLYRASQRQLCMSAGQLQNNMDMLAEELGLEETDRAIWGIFVRYGTHDPFESLLDDLCRGSIPAMELLAQVSGLDRKSLAFHLGDDGRLLNSGLLERKSFMGRHLDNLYGVPDAVLKGLQKADELTDIRSCILGRPCNADLLWNDYSHLGDVRERIERFLSTAMKKQTPGINVLLWGQPGTGKTEFCKTLAAKLDTDLYAVGERDEDGDEPSRLQRIADLRIAQNLMRYQKRCLLMFDEMDDILEVEGSNLFSGKKRAQSKVYTNRLFENNPVPTIWIINNVGMIDQAILRRMSLVIEFKSPPAAARKEVWSRILARNEVKLDEQEITDLSKLDIAPAILNNAVRYASLSTGNAEDICFAAAGVVEAMGGKLPPRTVKKDDYLPALINADTDLASLTMRFQKLPERRFSLCLYGPPGTGKTAYVRHLADELGMDVRVKRASDLLGPFVGETEQQIASAFREAERNGSFLVFDEADSLLSDRRSARQSWQVSQVNEMLTWMESHPLPFACTTNLRERLDPASLRRFTFKCCLDYLGRSQAEEAFRFFFDLPLSPVQLAALSHLTPGDFVVVKKKAALLGCDSDIEALVSMLRDEVAAREETPQADIGFCHQR